MSEHDEPQELTDDTDPWHYLKIAYDLEAAASQALAALQQGETFVGARRIGIKSYRTNHRRFVRYLGKTRDYDGKEPSFGEVIMAIALAKLASPDRSRFEIDYDPLRHPSNAYSPVNWEEIQTDLCRRLSEFDP